MSDERPSIGRRTVLKTVGAAGVAGGLGGITTASPGREPGPRENEVLVGVSASASDRVDAVAPHVPDRAEVVHENETLGYVAVSFPEQADQAREAFVEAVVERPHVKYAEPNATYEAEYTPNDPRYADQYVPQQVGADSAWDVTLGDCGCTIAIIDTGIQYDHPDLGYCRDPVIGYDFADDDGDPYPDDPSSEYHGTHVAGIAAAKTDNGVGMAGIAGTSLAVARALDESGSGSLSDIADAIQWAADQGADVINLSLGGGGYSSTMKNAVSYANNQGSLLVGAAGGSYGSSVSYPAAYDEVIAVAALDENENLANFSNVGPEIELAAPGVDVLSTTTTDRGSYEQLSGTSMAAAVVSGVAALVCAGWDVPNHDIRRHLKATAMDVGLSSDEQGCGQVNAAGAVGTDPANSGTCGDGGGDDPGGPGECGDTSTSETVSDSLSSSSDYDCWSWNWTYDEPCEVVVTLDGPSDADFDLYVSEGTTACPSPWSYDYRSITTDSQEQVVVSDPDTSTALQIDVESYSGSGSYDLTITERTV